MRRFALVSLCWSLAACPAINSKPCSADTECPADQRCRRGACGPICLNDGECGDGQACVGGRCEVRPECAQDTDCASGFTCASGRCRCTTDAACAANQSCVEGVCKARARCRLDGDCSNGTRCEVTQGLCVPSCRLPTDCAPNLDPQAALALYACLNGTCARRCTTDLTCAADGVVCKDGLCTVSDCRTKADCPDGQYCTSATFGRCQVYETCTSSSECDPNFRCQKFSQNQCPPGFDCSQSICLELPRCFIDSDCVSGVPGTMASQPNGFCAEGHCQPTDRCLTSTSCTQGRVCIAGLCVPPVCRGHAECGAGKACVDGACTDAPSGTDIARLGLHPAEALVEVGDTLQLQLTAYRLDQSSYPLGRGAFTVLDEAGMPSGAATVSNDGRLTAVAPGVVRVKAEVMMSFSSPVEARVRIYPRVTMGRRVLVVDWARRRPIAGAVVWGCLDADCAMPTEAVTDSLGLAGFPMLGAGAATFTVVSAATRMDGKPTHERVSIVSTAATDLYVPLRDNPARAATGFNGTIGFQQVRASGAYWLGLIATGIGDLPGMRLTSLLGDPVFTEIPNVNQRVPIPGAVVLYTSPGLNIPTEVKPRSLGFGQAGDRPAVAFATRGNLSELATLRSVDLLSYLGSADFTLQQSIELSARLDVPDTADVNGNGLCANPQRCPMGSEDVPDWAGFPRLSMSPNRQLTRRTEVVVPRVPSTIDTVVVAGLEADAFRGALPTGFASKTAGPPGNDGTRPVEPVMLRTGVPFAGIESSSPGLWTVALSTRSSAETARLALPGATLPTKLAVQPFLPLPAVGTFAPLTRTWTPGQPEWGSLYSTGAEVGRLSLTGSDVRHTVYFPITVGQTSVVVPRAPAGPGRDPAGELEGKLEIVGVDLASSTGWDELISFPGVNLSSWNLVMDGYSRIDR
ncbi:MAG: hypothetical protein JNJ54_06495 [Myxococcaceae bacterium]|nr:hypothetical protein [Myxococcaceae bacterium]